MVELAKPKGARRGPKLARFLITLAIVAVLAVAGYYLWKYFNTYETTDDAQVDGHINAVSARINGNVVEVLAEDEKYRKSGRRAGPHRSQGLRSRARQSGSRPGRRRSGPRKLAHRHPHHQHQHVEPVEDGEFRPRRRGSCV